MLIFVLSSVHPDDFQKVLGNVKQLMKRDAVLLFRDYGPDDMAKGRFKEDRKLKENLFVRQDGTFTQFFDREMLSDIFSKAGFVPKDIQIIEKQTVNKKKNTNLERRFIQACFTLP